MNLFDHFEHESTDIIEEDSVKKLYIHAVNERTEGLGEPSQTMVHKSQSFEM